MLMRSLQVEAYARTSVGVRKATDGDDLDVDVPDHRIMSLFYGDGHSARSRYTDEHRRPTLVNAGDTAVKGAIGPRFIQAQSV